MVKRRVSIFNKVPNRRDKIFFNKWLILILLIAAAFIIFIFLFNSSPPQILSASVYPEKVMPGQVMIVTVQVKDTLGIKSAVAIFDNEKMPDERNIPLITGTGRDGVYETRWIVHDTKAQGWYNTTLIFTGILGKKSMQKIAWQDPTVTHKADEITGGTFGEGDYVFPSNISINGTAVINSTILLKPESNPANQTGYAKIYYKVGETVIDSYTKLLLHMDGTDGSTTFTDSETTPKSVTANGNAQIDTAQSKFGGASGLFDGTGDYLTVPDSDDWNFGTNPFTIDFWVRYNDHTSPGQQVLYNQYLDGSHTTYFYSYSLTNKLYFGSYVTGAVLTFNCDFTPSDNTWYHISLVRIDNSDAATGWRFFINGISQTLTKIEGSWNAAMPDIAGSVYISSEGGTNTCLNGWLDEYRVSKGIARWTSAFTPPASAYADIPSGLVFQYQNGTEKLLAGE